MCSALASACVYRGYHFVFSGIFTPLLPPKKEGVIMWEYLELDTKITDEAAPCAPFTVIYHKSKAM